jgi:CRP/FNR family transcriptional regulator, cyclic AMP receptor protein
MSETVNILTGRIASHPFFAGMPTALVHTVAGLATPLAFEAGTWITRTGQPAETLYLVTDGRVGVEIAAPGHAPLVVATVHAGEIVGWSWFLEPHRWHFDTLALDDVQAIAIDASILRVACADDHELGYQVASRLTRVVAARLEATRHQLVDVYGATTS